MTLNCSLNRRRLHFSFTSKDHSRCVFFVFFSASAKKENLQLAPQRCEVEFSKVLLMILLFTTNSRDLELLLYNGNCESKSCFFFFFVFLRFVWMAHRRRMLMIPSTDCDYTDFTGRDLVDDSYGKLCCGRPQTTPIFNTENLLLSFFFGGLFWGNESKIRWSLERSDGGDWGNYGDCPRRREILYRFLHVILSVIFVFLSLFLQYLLLSSSIIFFCSCSLTRIAKERWPLVKFQFVYKIRREFLFFLINRTMKVYFNMILFSFYQIISHL